MLTVTPAGGYGPRFGTLAGVGLGPGYATALPIVGDYLTHGYLSVVRSTAGHSIVERLTAGLAMLERSTFGYANTQRPTTGAARIDRSTEGYAS